MSVIIIVVASLPCGTETRQDMIRTDYMTELMHEPTFLFCMCLGYGWCLTNCHGICCHGIFGDLQAAVVHYQSHAVLKNNKCTELLLISVT